MRVKLNPRTGEIVFRYGQTPTIQEIKTGRRYTRWQKNEVKRWQKDLQA